MLKNGLQGRKTGVYQHRGRRPRIVYSYGWFAKCVRRVPKWFLKGSRNASGGFAKCGGTRRTRPGAERAAKAARQGEHARTGEGAATTHARPKRAQRTTAEHARTKQGADPTDGGRSARSPPQSGRPSRSAKRSGAKAWRPRRAGRGRKDGGGRGRDAGEADARAGRRTRARKAEPRRGRDRTRPTRAQALRPFGVGPAWGRGVAAADTAHDGGPGRGTGRPDARRETRRGRRTRRRPRRVHAPPPPVRCPFAASPLRGAAAGRRGYGF